MKQDSQPQPLLTCIVEPWLLKELVLLLKGDLISLPDFGKGQVSLFLLAPKAPPSGD